MLLQCLYQAGEMEKARHTAMLCRGLIETSLLSNCWASTALNISVLISWLHFASSISKGGSQIRDLPHQPRNASQCWKTGAWRENLLHQRKPMIIPSKHEAQPYAPGCNTIFPYKKHYIVFICHLIWLL